MAISSKEKDTAVASKEITMDPIESKEALPWITEVWEYLMRDTSKSLHGVFIKNEQEQSENTPPENEGEDELVLPQRGQVQRNFHHNAAPQSAYLTKWKPRHLFYVLYIGLLLISGVAGHGKRGDPNDPLVINTRKRTVQQGDEYVVTEWPRTDDQQVFPFNILIGEDYECSKESFKDDSLSICTVSLENSTNCGLSLKNFSEKYQLVYLRVINDFAYCIVQNAINNHTIMSGAVFVIPNKTLDPGNEESPTVSPTTEATTCKPGNEESPTVSPTTEATTCKPAASRNDDCWYKSGFFGLLAVLVLVLLALAFFFGWQIYKNREKSGGTEVGRPQQREEEKKLNAPVPVSVQIQSPTDS